MTKNHKNNIINGNSGNNTLKGADKNDIINGREGSDNLYGGKGHNDLTGGGGTDTSLTNSNQDNYFLTSGKGNSDTIHIAKGDSAFQLDKTLTPINFDRVFGMDKFDKIDLPSDKIMKDAHVNPAHAKDTAHFDSFTIKDGVITLQDSHHHTVNINSVALAGEAYHFIIQNCLPVNLDKAVALVVNVNYPMPLAPSYHHNYANTHTVLLEAHSGTAGAESITAVDIVGNLSQTISHQII